MKIIHLLLIISCFLWSACKTDNNSVQSTIENNANTPEVEKSLSITPIMDSYVYNDVVLSKMSFKQGIFNFSVSGDNYELGLQTPDAKSQMCANSTKGQHIHLIIDNKPYSAQYTSEFEFPIEDGNHQLLAFLSRSYHESIKTDKAHIAQEIVVKNGHITESKNFDKPALFYSRPKGKYVGKDAKKIMLDFYAINTTINKDTLVEANINGTNYYFDQWTPYMIEGLPMGKNSISLQLVNRDKKPIESITNRVTRTFELIKDLTPEN